MTDKAKTVEEEINEIIIEILGVDAHEIKEDSNFRDDLQADSLDLVELIMAFEEKFEGEISDEDAQKITTVGGAVKFVKTKMS